MKKRLPLIVIVLVIVIGLGAVRMKRAKQKNHAPLLKSVPMVVETAPVDRQAVSSGRHVLGEVIGADEDEIAPRIMARVLEIKVREGDRVSRGQVMAILDDREQQDGLEAARIAHEAAAMAARVQSEATARDKDLYDAKAISQEQWDRSRTREATFNAKLAEADRNLKHARTRLSYTRLSASVDGVVTQRLADPGDLAVPGKPLLKVVHQANVRVRGKLPQEDLVRLEVGQPVTVTAGDHTVTAEVSRVFPAMDPNHLAVFEVDLANPPASFVAGMTVGVDISFSLAKGISVPVTALLEGENGAWVFKVKEQVIHTVRIEVLATGSTRVAVSGDLAEGDLVVTARPSRLMMLSEGQTVRLAPQGGQQ